MSTSDEQIFDNTLSADNTLSVACMLHPDLTLKAPITIAADNVHKSNSFSLFSEKIRLDISCESSARQRIHMKHQALFSKKKKIKVSSAAFWRFNAEALI